MHRAVVAVVGSLAILLSSGSPVAAKCGKDCESAIQTTFKSCKAACEKGKAGKDCRKSCLSDRTAAKKTCKTATNPTPPDCGQTTTSTTVP